MASVTSQREVHTTSNQTPDYDRTAIVWRGKELLLRLSPIEAQCYLDLESVWLWAIFVEGECYRSRLVGSLVATEQENQFVNRRKRQVIAVI